MQHFGWRPAIHRRKLGGALMVGIFLVTTVIGTLLAQFQGTLPGTATEVVLYAFKGPSHGANPQGGVVRDSVGNLYGTTQFGGAGGQGVVFKVDPTGHETVLYSFTGGADGGDPESGVIGDSASNLYGTTYNGACGGGFGCGVVYKLDATGHETVLHTFTGGSDGANPSSGVIRDSAGNLYGTTFYGGITTGGCAPYGCGVVFKLDATGHETVLYAFTGGSDGLRPSGGLIRDLAGNLYGTTRQGGFYGYGVVYKLDATGHETVLHTFMGGSDGDSPYAGVIGDGAGNLYGTTSFGGNKLCDCGGVYKLDATGHVTVLHSFTGGSDGGYSYSGVIRDSAGNLYGTTQQGGFYNHGVVYKLDATGHETVLYSFTGGADGDGPFAGLIVDSAGNLYGPTPVGGLANLGAVYKLDPTGHETALYSFPAGADGYGPQAGVIGDGAGNLYGTTVQGGFYNLGVVYKLDATGHQTVLHTFTGLADGAYPAGGVIPDAASNLYGTVYFGGTANAGVVYKLDATGHETVFYNFTGRNDGGGPYAGVIGDGAGNLYGTTVQGGSYNHGVVYKLDTTGHETVLYTFTGGADGGDPFGGLSRDSTGNLYGTTTAGGSTTGICGGGGGPGGCGVVFKLDPTGHETVLYSFTHGADGWYPAGGVIPDAAGNLYGTAYGGGTTGTCGQTGCGVVFKLDPAGHESVLYTFTGGADGAKPQAGVIRDSAGNLYGTTTAGGITTAICGGPFSGCGVVYRIDPTGHETVLSSFAGPPDGSFPQAGVIRDSAGNLYGTTAGGGPANAGVVYRIKP
jgi:uncharacterized repeat protein (TIGR03803 family)